MICTNFDNALKRLQSSNTTNSSGQLGPSSSATNARNASSHSFAPSSLVPIKRRLQVGSSDSHGSTSRREDNVPDNNTASTSTSLSTPQQNNYTRSSAKESRPVPATDRPSNAHRPNPPSTSTPASAPAHARNNLRNATSFNSPSPMLSTPVGRIQRVPSAPSVSTIPPRMENSDKDDWKSRLTTMPIMELNERFQQVLRDLDLINRERSRRDSLAYDPAPSQHDTTNDTALRSKSPTIMRTPQSEPTLLDEDLTADVVIENDESFSDVDISHVLDDDVLLLDDEPPQAQVWDHNDDDTPQEPDIFNEVIYPDDNDIQLFEDDDNGVLDSNNPQFCHPWSRDVMKTLNYRYKMISFRRHQLEAINDCLAGKDVFVLMPTGGGKSLCFQVPALISSGKTSGLTVVVSPLLSLIDDQVQALRRRGIPALKLVGQMGAKDNSFVYKEMQMLSSSRQHICLLYTTPESIAVNNRMRDALKGLYNKNLLARFAIDEAHCISDWGHDFRTGPEYKNLRIIKSDYPRVPIIALTATANRRVQQDVIQNLQLNIKEPFCQSFNRPNLTYEVRRKGKNVVEGIAQVIKNEFKDMSGIVYCLSKRDCQVVAQELNDKWNIRATHYHAGLEKKDRATVQAQWIKGAVKVICATIAFGMGIDKPDVRFVIHHTIPKSLEGYYQETGRAGRDGKRSRCILYFCWADRIRSKAMSEKNTDAQPLTPEQLERRHNNLERVVAYCINEVDCRRRQVLAYFDEEFPKEKCKKTCDNCQSNADLETKDVTSRAGEIIKMVEGIERLTRSGPTLSMAIDVFRGSQLKKILDSRLDTLPEHGCGKELPKVFVERLIQHVVSEGGLTENLKTSPHGATYAYLVPGKKHRLILQGKKQIKMTFRKGADDGNVGGRAQLREDSDPTFALNDFRSPPPQQDNDDSNLCILSDDEIIQPSRPPVTAREMRHRYSFLPNRTRT